jgi:hypothetical protein
MRQRVNVISQRRTDYLEEPLMRIKSGAWVGFEETRVSRVVSLCFSAFSNVGNNGKSNSSTSDGGDGGAGSTLVNLNETLIRIRQGK